MENMEIGQAVTVIDAFGATRDARIAAVGVTGAVRITWGHGSTECWLTIPASKVTPVMVLNVSGDVTGGN